MRLHQFPKNTSDRLSDSYFILILLTFGFNFLRNFASVFIGYFVLVI